MSDPVIALSQLQTTLDKYKQNMPEGAYLELCNDTKAVHTQLAAQPQVTQPHLQDIARWTTDERPGQFTYDYNLPARVRTTTNVDLRTVYDCGLGGFGHRYFWYRDSPDGQYHELPMHLVSVESEPDINRPTTLHMQDNVSGQDIIEYGLDFEMEYGEHIDLGNFGF